MSRKCFIITGASSGLGKAMKDFLLENTVHHIFSLSRKPDKSDEKKSRVIYYKCDLNELEEFDFKRAFQKMSKYDELVFVNNAATIIPLDSIGKFSYDEMESYFRINIISPARLINEFVALSKQKDVSVINITSGAANKAFSHWALYCTAKAAIQMYCNVLALDHPKISVQNIDPGVIDTQMQHEIRASKIPDLAIFKSFAEKEQLKKPLDVASEILQHFI